MHTTYSLICIHQMSNILSRTCQKAHREWSYIEPVERCGSSCWECNPDQGQYQHEIQHREASFEPEKNTQERG